MPGRFVEGFTNGVIDGATQNSMPAHLEVFEAELSHMLENTTAFDWEQLGFGTPLVNTAML